jgi:hypothetical protein
VKAVLGVSFAFTFLFMPIAGIVVGWAGVAARSLF